MTPDSPHESRQEVTVWFDGVCNLCNGFVDFLIRRDRDGRIRYGALQSPEGEELRRRTLDHTPDPGTIIVTRGTETLFRSTGVLVAVATLGGGWKLTRILFVFPRFFRDFVYNAVARSRYRVFGRRNTCRVPTPEERSRFVDSGDS